MEDLKYLQLSFEEFNKTAFKIMESYAKLEQEFANLNRELESKNAELERTIEEKEDVKNYLFSILESLTTGVVVTDLAGNVQTANRCAEIFFQDTREGLLGKHISVLLEGFALSDWDKLLISAYQENDAGQKIFLNGKILDLFGSPVRSRTGQVLGKVFVLRDITKMEKLEEMAKRAEKLAAMGEMAANIAHEIRNPLGSIELFASLLLKELEDKRDRQRVMEIISSVKNMDNKIANLLFFAKTEKPHMAEVIINDLIREIINFSQEIIDKAGIILDVHLDNNDSMVLGNAEMLRQVFLNLILNALQAMPEGGRLSIKSKESNNYLGTGNIPHLEIIFADTGSGIIKENLSRIFDPFYTTKEVGSGLGLAIAHNILAIHNGSIQVESDINRGSTFTVILPRI